MTTNTGIMLVVDDDAICRLKQRFFSTSAVSTSAVTDVISFRLGDNPDTLAPGSTLDCEVVVNAQRAQQVASKCDASPQAELNLYVVHGLLHQLGFGDQTPESADLMHHKEDQLLDELGLGKVFSQKR